MDDNENYYQNRLTAIAKKDYPHEFRNSHSVSELLQSQNALRCGEMTTISVRIGGRVLSKRFAGNKLIFYDLIRGGLTLQIVANFRNSGKPFPEFQQDHFKIKRGDIVGFKGLLGKSDTNELSVFCSEAVLLAPCLYMLPKSNDHEDDKPIMSLQTRYSKRYLDGIVNYRQFRSTFETRHHIIKFICDFFSERSFIQVSTPILSSHAGGAVARPFKTHHNDLDTELFMRVAPELYLKQLVVAGLDRVFEIGPQFRNESCDATHNPEFITIEAYQTFADYNDMMIMTEHLLSKLVYAIHSKYQIDVMGQTVDFTPPWPRLDIIQTLEKETHQKFPDRLDSQEANVFLLKLCHIHSIDCASPQTNARLLDKLIGHFIESQALCSPIFIVNHPQIMSPLAKCHRDRPGLTERFELFVSQTELCNAYTEQNNPIEQREAFKMQAENRSDGDEEAMMLDEPFVMALEHGLPPTAGWGMGIDRLIMMLTNATSIRDVMAFPYIT